MRGIYFILLLFLVSSNCDEDNVDSDYEEIMLEDGCNINLTKVGTFSNVSGILMSTGSQIDPFVIEGAPDVTKLGPLLPCNLPPGIGSDGLEIRFSGQLYEDVPHSSYYGIFFELTQLKVKIE